MIFERTTQIAEPIRFARQVSLIVFALVMVGTTLLAYCNDVHLRLVGALCTGIGIGLQAASKLEPSSGRS